MGHRVPAGRGHEVRPYHYPLSFTKPGEWSHDLFCEKKCASFLHQQAACHVMLHEAEPLHIPELTRALENQGGVECRQLYIVLSGACLLVGVTTTHGLGGKLWHARGMGEEPVTAWRFFQPFKYVLF
jgi:hypothetical protein